MQIEIFSLTASEKQISVDLVAVCDSFSSLLYKSIGNTSHEVKAGQMK